MVKAQLNRIRSSASQTCPNLLCNRSSNNLPVHPLFKVFETHLHGGHHANKRSLPLVIVQTAPLLLLLFYMILDKILLAAAATTTSLSSVNVGRASLLNTYNMFNHVCLGGTFDGIHDGHKLLFNEAIRLCKKRLVVGVTDTNMLKNKVLWELIKPVDERISSVREHLQQINPNLTYQVVPICDIYGPAITDKELECIVVSEETIRGASKINEVRTNKGWHELDVHVVDLVKENNTEIDDAKVRLNESKVSSSLARLEKLGTILKPPIPNDSIPSRPYLIGLTGGIASGKTTIGKYLESLGFGYINYDLLGHKTYERIGSPVYKQIVEYFGYEVLNEVNNQIDRAKLGKIVFSDKNKLEKLNSIVWPAIYELVDIEIDKLKSSHDVIVLESALLVESQQTKRVHQVWTSIVPPEEAIKRQMESRHLSREEAEKRVNSQTDNLTRVRNSNAVFCTMWEEEYTRKQVSRCVQELREKYLNVS